MNIGLRDKDADRKSNRTMVRRQRTSGFITRDLDLTDKQHQKFDSIWSHYNDIRYGIGEEMEANRRQMGVIISTTDVDTSSFYAMSAVQSQLMLALDHSMVDMNLALRTTLNDDQIKLFLKRIEMGNKRRLSGRKANPKIKK